MDQEVAGFDRLVREFHPEEVISEQRPEESEGAAGRGPGVARARHEWGGEAVGDRPTLWSALDSGLPELGSNLSGDPGREGSSGS